MASPMNIPAGSRIRFQCVYDNPDAKDYFQGQSADADEMCMFVGTYYPQMTVSDDFCASGRDMMGTGTAACGASLSCLRACPPESLPGSSKGAAGITSVAPCAQKCTVDSCPSASSKLVAVNSCTTKNCATECQTPGADACTACVASKCAAQVAECQADVCQ
jgi:hypothetical protein